MSRREELAAIVGEDATTTRLIDEAVELEEELERLRKLPKIKVDPDNPERQKTTPAAKLYKEMLQQYTNIMKVLMHASGRDEAEEDSPLRDWMRKHTGAKC